MNLRDTIIGVFKTPNTKKALEEEIAFTAAERARPPFQGHLAFGMDPQRLGVIVRAADQGNTLDWFILAEEIEELYAHYASVLSKRKRQVCQLPIKVEAADDSAECQKDRDFVQDWLETEVLQNAMFDIADGIGKGFSINEIVWETKPGSFRPAELIYRPQRFFEVSWQDGETLWLRDAGCYRELASHKFLQHRHRAKSGSIVRGGLTRTVAFLWMFQAFTLKDWALFTQAYGFPIRVGRYGPEASGADKSVLWRAVSSIAGDVAAIIPKSMEIEFVKDGDRVGGSTLYEKRADWLDRSVSKVVLGGTAGTDAISGGHAVGKEHRSAEQDVERFDARLMGVSITQQLARSMIQLTFGEREKYPRIVIGQEETAPLKDLIAAVADLGPLGLKVKASEIRERLDLTEPEDGDETIGGIQVQAEKPPVNPEAGGDVETQGAMLGALRGMISHHGANVPDELVELMTERLAREAAGALSGMTASVRAEFEAARDMKDLQRRLRGLQLNRQEFTHAMAQGMALAELVGQASVMAELGRGR